MILVLVQAACADSTRSADPEQIELAPPQELVKVPCERPVRIPETATTQEEQEALWLRDRVNLANCADRHRALVAWANGVTEVF